MDVRLEYFSLIFFYNEVLCSMEQRRKDEIYNRLLSIKFSIEMKALPDPSYINERLGQCHVFIEEIERVIIELSRELSVLQQALNNALASYESKKEGLLTSDDDIRSLPSIKDREARANSLLRHELDLIRQYKNEETNINNLLKVSYLKNRNLNRANQDIKMQLRLLESQLKLGAPAITDNITKNFLEELNKSNFDKDTFQNAVTSVSQEIVADPTEALNIDELIETVSETGATPEIPEKESNNVLEGAIDLNDLLTDIIPTTPKKSENNSSEGIDLDEELPTIAEEDLLLETKSNAIEINAVETTAVDIDLDTVIDFKKGGNSSQSNIQKEPVDKTQKESHQKTQIGIDIDDLLNNLNSK
jgi:hypothetical protein